MGSAYRRLTSTRRKLIEYLSKSQEKADEDKIIQYFRSLYTNFSRQEDAKRADGYVPGHFVLELKGKKSDWLSGFFQGLSYKKDLSFSLVVVASEGFLAIWDVREVEDSILSEVLELRKSKAPNIVGKELAQKYKDQKISMLKKSIFNFNNELLKKNSLNKEIERFETILEKCRIVRLPVTTKNFSNILKQMKNFFNPEEPKKVVRAFYNMLFDWNENSVLKISSKNPNQATLGGEYIEGLIPGKRLEFKKFVESYYIYLCENENKDDFFAKYDIALDVVDPEFRKKHGIFFTDLDLSKFAMWFVRKELGDIGDKYLVIDPACGSGNLVTNWKSPLELRHKVVSEIEPELLYTVEKRMKGDAWHNGKFTVVPKVSEGKGLNFLDKSAEEYILILKKYLKDKGIQLTKPIAFLCNPPYRGDDDQSASGIQYDIHNDILKMTGQEGSAERFSCFLAQMKLICQKAKDNGLPEDSLLLLFTKISWLENRKGFQNIKSEILRSFQDVGGFFVQSKEFFSGKGNFPIAFTIWKYKGANANLNINRNIVLKDLSNITRAQLARISWGPKQGDIDSLNEVCNVIESNGDQVSLNIQVMNIKKKYNLKMKNFKRGRRKNEVGRILVSGLPKNDYRHKNKSAYGEVNGSCIGFLDNLTPCRIKNSRENNMGVWFCLEQRFMRLKRNRCFSGRPDDRGYWAEDQDTAKKTFLWFALARTFMSKGFPLWADAMEMWGVPEIDNDLTKIIFSIGFAENECVEATFPANNPVEGAPEIVINNPMTPLNNNSFWCEYMQSFFDETSEDIEDQLVLAVENLFQEWKKEFTNNPEIHVEYREPYFVGGNKILTRQAGIRQIKDYAAHYEKENIKIAYRNVQKKLDTVKEKFHTMLMDKNGLDYFGKARNQADLLTQEITEPELQREKEEFQKEKKKAKKRRKSRSDDS